MRIGPHPGLNEAASKAIEIDFGMKDGELHLQTRANLSFYVERRYGLDLDPEQVSPERQQIVLLNRNEVEEARKVKS